MKSKRYVLAGVVAAALGIAGPPLVVRMGRGQSTAPGEPKVATAPAAKLPVPSGEALKESTGLVTVVFKDDVAAAKSLPQKADLAKKMLASGIEEKDIAGKYVMLQMARDMGIESGDAETVFGAIGEMDRTYMVDALKLNIEGAQAVSKNARTPEQRKALAQNAGRLLEQAIAIDRYDLARSMGELYQSTARLTNDVALQKEATAAAQRARELEGAYAAIKKSLDFLAVRLTDPEANFKVGRFLCLYKGDWARGLPMLSVGSDKTLAALAQAELAVPATPDEQVKVADAWWDTSLAASAVIKSNTQRHAGEMYAAALPKLSGLAKVRVEKRLKELEGTAAAPAAAPVVASLKAEEDIASKILSKVPKEFLPTKDDAGLDLRTKSEGLMNWLRENKLSDQGGASASFVLDFKSVDVSVSSPMSSTPNQQRVHIHFDQASEFKGISCDTTLMISRAITGTDDPEYKQAKSLDKDGRGSSYVVTAPISTIYIYYSKTSAGSAPKIHISINTLPGPYSAKARPKTP